MKKLRDSILQFFAVALLFILIFAAVRLLFYFRITDGLQIVFKANETWGWLLYILLNAVLFCLCMPGAVLGSMAGAVLGLAWGSILFIFSSLLACLFVFYLTRLFLFNRVQQKVEKSTRLKNLQVTVENEGMLLLCLIRFLPVHATVLNLLLAVTRVNVRQFLMSCACMIPEWLAYIYLGVTAAEAERLGLANAPSAVHDILKIITFILVITAISYAGRVAQRSLQNAKSNAGSLPDSVSPN
jgi:uncharacterized membrane protein YdjX (TVP38/TMEM64 family)